MKKTFLILTFLLALLLLASCGGEECTSHLDNDGDELCDSCGADVPCNHPDVDGNYVCDHCSKALPFPSSALSEAVISQIEGARSYMIDITLKTSNDSSYWYKENAKVEKSSDYYEMTTELYITVSLDENNEIAALVESVIGYKMGKLGTSIKTDRTPVAYFVDGVFYTYDEDLDAYLKGVEIDISIIEEIIEGIAGEGETPPELDAETLSEIGDMLIDSLGIADGKGSASLDITLQINALLDELKKFDPASIKLSDILEGLIKSEYGEQATLADVKDELFTLLSLTVDEAIKLVDDYCIETYGADLQGLLDGIFASPDIETFLEALISAYAAQSGEQIDVDAEVAELLATLAEFDLKQKIIDAGIADRSVLEAIFIIFFEATEEQIPSIDEFKAEFDAILNYTLADIDELSELYIFTTLKQLAETVRIDRFKLSADVGLRDAVYLDYLEGRLDISFTVSTPSEVAGKTDKTETDLELSIKLHSLSGEGVEIELDSDKEIYYDLLYVGFTGQSEYDELYLDFDEDGVYVCFSTFENDSYVEIVSDALPFDILKSTNITVPSGKLDLYVDGELVTDSDLKDLSVSIDIFNEEFVFLSDPRKQ